MPHTLIVAALAACTAPVTPDRPAAAPDATRYCMDVRPTDGSRLPHRVCMTRGEWLQEGVDPLVGRRR